MFNHLDATSRGRFLLLLVIVIAASVSLFLLKFIYLMVRHGGKFESLESLD